MSLDELQQRVVKSHDVPDGATGLDIREAVWRLVDSQVAEFTEGRKVRAIRANARRLSELRR